MNCAQPGCTGQIEDGYCNVCGMAAASAPQAAPGGVATAEPATAATVGSATTRTRVSRRSRLGAGLVEVPPVPYRDPASAILADPMVAENRRFCARCGEPVGRGQNGSPGRTQGFCRHCGAPFTFIPKLGAGEVLASQYEVVGCLAHGGLGWIYLAKDRNVSDRWVVLKGLLNTDDEDAMAAALAERQFLAEVEHPNIVKIFNFVQHEGSGYIVMEYVGGASLKELLASRREQNGGSPVPLPASQAVAYMLEILPALGYLHQTGLLFCDFKLDNVIQTQHSLKLIDLGGVYRIGDETSPVYGTVGYQAPEIADTGPSIPSDLFTVARTLAMLCIDFRGYQSSFKYTLPPQDTFELFTRFDSLYRFLEKGTARNPDDRFQSADEMAEQLLGVLREIVAAENATPVPSPSHLFTGDFRANPDRPDWRLLPAPQVAADDPAAGYLATLAATDPAQTVALLENAPERTIEVDLQLARELIERGECARAEELLSAIEASDPREWRVQWYSAVASLATGRPYAARDGFRAVYWTLPGEPAPKLALGVAAEHAEDWTEAARWYDVVSRTDPSFTTACFGLARCRHEAEDRFGSMQAYERVPESSSSYVEAQVARIHTLIDFDDGDEPAVPDLQTAASRMGRLRLAGEQRDLLTSQLLAAALELLEEGRLDDDPDIQLADVPLVGDDIRAALERTYRSLARAATSADERIRLVDWANEVRPRTWT